MKSIWNWLFGVLLLIPMSISAQNYGCITHVSNQVISAVESGDGMCDNLVELCLAKNQESMIEMDFQLNHMYGSMGKKYDVASQPVGYQICHIFEFSSPCHTDISLTGYGRNNKGSFCGAWSTYFPLPVELIRFEGNVVNGRSCLEWEVAQESEIRRYIVERSSNGQVFIPVAQLQAQAEGLDAYTYSFCDEDAQNNVYLYRLAIQENSGEINYSNTIAIYDPGYTSPQPRVWPVPSSHLIVVDNLEEITQVVSNAGEQVSLESLGNSAYGISHLSSGTYYIQDRRGKTLRFVKK